MYSKTLVAGWGDMDFNAHMGAAAYLVKCVDVRMMFFAENGYPMGEFARLRLGPVAMKDDLEYFSEVGLLDTIIVTMSLVGMSIDGSRWRLRQDVLRPDGKACARLTSSSGWMDLAARKLAAPRPPCWVSSRRTWRWTTSSNCPQACRRSGVSDQIHQTSRG